MLVLKRKNGKEFIFFLVFEFFVFFFYEFVGESGFSIDSKSMGDYANSLAKQGEDKPGEYVQSAAEPPHDDKQEINHDVYPKADVKPMIPSALFCAFFINSSSVTITIIPPVS
jgi:hypothetical protein